MLPSKAFKTLILFVIDLYQLTARPWFVPCCRFAPSCSDYAKVAVNGHGLKAAGLILKRLARCHPFHPGGFDPVPQNHG